MNIKLEVVSSFLYKKLDELLDQKKLQHKDIVLFGLNSTSYCIEEYLTEKGYSVYAYVDNNKKRINEKDNAYLPEELLGEFNEKVVILLASKYYTEMENQLQKLGYKEGQHIIKVVDYFGIDNILEQEAVVEKTELKKDEIRELQINMLEHIKQICLENDLRYFLAAGTMLGAVRHNGFIPWDDDIDLLMPFKDCKRMMKILEKDERYQPFDINHQPEQCYKFYFRVVDTHTCLKTWDYPFLTTAGISIDIFPLSGVPGNEEERFEYINKIAQLKTDYLTTYISYNQNSEKIKQKRKKLKEEIIEMISRYDFDNSLYVGNPVSKYREKETMQKNIFETTIEILFEGECYLVPKQYDRYLRSLYGEYMVLPAEDARVTTHNYRVYNFDEGRN